MKKSSSQPLKVEPSKGAKGEKVGNNENGLLSIIWNKAN
jgi:hypothetical protein